MFSLVDLTDPQLNQIPIEEREDLVQYAERRIMSALTHARFEVDADGLPVDKAVVTRLQFAIVEQALTWHRWGINPTKVDDDERPVQSVRLGPATYTYGSNDGHADQRSRARLEVSPEAYAWIRPLLHQPTY